MQPCLVTQRHLKSEGIRKTTSRILTYLQKGFLQMILRIFARKVNQLVYNRKYQKSALLGTCNALKRSTLQFD